MKFYKIFLTALLALYGTTLSAQYNTLNEFYLGPSGGVTMSTVNLVPKMVDKLFLMGKTEGISARYISENHFGFQVDFNYLETGWKEDLKGTKKASDYSYARNLTFVEMPFLLHANTGPKAVRAFLNVGPKLSYLLSEKEEIRDQSSENQMVQHGKPVEKPFQYGLLGGVGFEVHLKRSVIGLEGRYYYQLSNLFNDAIGEDFINSNIQVASLHAYYYFQLGGYKK